MTSRSKVVTLLLMVTAVTSQTFPGQLVARNFLIPQRFHAPSYYPLSLRTLARPLERPPRNDEKNGSQNITRNANGILPEGVVRVPFIKKGNVTVQKSRTHPDSTKQDFLLQPVSVKSVLNKSVNPNYSHSDKPEIPPSETLLKLKQNSYVEYQANPEIYQTRSPHTTIKSIRNHQEVSNDDNKSRSQQERPHFSFSNENAGREMPPYERHHSYYTNSDAERPPSERPQSYYENIGAERLPSERGPQSYYENTGVERTPSERRPQSYYENTGAEQSSYERPQSYYENTGAERPPSERPQSYYENIGAERLPSERKPQSSYENTGAEQSSYERRPQSYHENIRSKRPPSERGSQSYYENTGAERPPSERPQSYYENIGAERLPSERKPQSSYENTGAEQSSYERRPQTYHENTGAEQSSYERRPQSYHENIRSKRPPSERGSQSYYENTGGERPSYERIPQSYYENTGGKQSSYERRPQSYYENTGGEQPPYERQPQSYLRPGETRKSYTPDQRPEQYDDYYYDPDGVQSDYQYYEDEPLPRHYTTPDQELKRNYDSIKNDNESQNSLLKSKDRDAVRPYYPSRTKEDSETNDHFTLRPLQPTEVFYPRSSYSDQNLSIPLNSYSHLNKYDSKAPHPSVPREELLYSSPVQNDDRSYPGFESGERQYSPLSREKQSYPSRVPTDKISADQSNHQPSNLTLEQNEKHQYNNRESSDPNPYNQPPSASEPNDQYRSYPLSSDQQPHSHRDPSAQRAYVYPKINEQISYPRHKSNVDRSHSLPDSSEQQNYPTSNSNRDRPRPPPEFYKQSYYPWYDSSDNYPYPPPESNDQRSYPRYDSSNDRPYPPPESNDQRSYPRYDSSNDRPYPTPESNDQRSYPRYESSNDRSYSPPESNDQQSYLRYDSSDDRPYPPPESNDQRSYPQYDSSDDRPYPPPESNDQRSYPRYDSNNDRPYSPPESNDQRSYPRYDSSNNRPYFPPESNDQQSYPLHDSIDQRPYPPSELSGQHSYSRHKADNDRSYNPPEVNNQRSYPRNQGRYLSQNPSNQHSSHRSLGQDQLTYSYPTTSDQQSDSLQHYSNNFNPDNPRSYSHTVSRDYQPFVHPDHQLQHSKNISHYHSTPHEQTSEETSYQSPNHQNNQPHQNIPDVPQKGHQLPSTDQNVKDTQHSTLLPKSIQKNITVYNPIAKEQTPSPKDKQRNVPQTFLPPSGFPPAIPFIRFQPRTIFPFPVRHGRHISQEIEPIQQTDQQIENSYKNAQSDKDNVKKSLTSHVLKSDDTLPSTVEYNKDTTKDYNNSMNVKQRLSPEEGGKYNSSSSVKHTIVDDNADHSVYPPQGLSSDRHEDKQLRPSLKYTKNRNLRANDGVLSSDERTQEKKNPPTSVDFQKIGSTEEQHKLKGDNISSSSSIELSNPLLHTKEDNSSYSDHRERTDIKFRSASSEPDHILRSQPDESIDGPAFAPGPTPELTPIYVPQSNTPEKKESATVSRPAPLELNRRLALSVSETHYGFGYRLPIKHHQDKNHRSSDSNLNVSINRPLETALDVTTYKHGRESHPNCVQGDNTYCLKDSEYPRELIMHYINNEQRAVSQLLADIGNQSNSQIVDPGLYSNGKFTYQFVSQNDKDSENNNDYNTCSSKVVYERPLRARNKQGQWKFILNLKIPNGGKKYTQTVRLETCMYPGVQCRSSSNSYSTRCHQKYNHQRLLAWENERGFHIDAFLLPAACSCHAPSVDEKLI
ncbi:uncharacterized protein LOC143238406 [Tachypleus tridentatus]|uniref:uncharacterized protein LOC143238406 n=1 Tax=Tachypleus tridentatus TaxID=6853 RepID=UPI003FD3781A